MNLAKPAKLSIICATCTKYRKAQELGLEKCLAKEGCGSPIVADTFHEYEGPITDFLKFCFVCGDTAKKAVAVKGHARRIGVCLEHVEFVITMAPKEHKRLPILQRTVVGDGEEHLAEKYLPKVQRTLGQALYEMEKGTFKPDS